jgi:hypothetical protein
MSFLLLHELELQLWCCHMHMAAVAETAAAAFVFCSRQARV